MSIKHREGVQKIVMPRVNEGIPHTRRTNRDIETLQTRSLTSCNTNISSNRDNNKIGR